MRQRFATFRGEGFDTAKSFKDALRELEHFETIRSYSARSMNSLTCKYTLCAKEVLIEKPYFERKKYYYF